MIRNSGTAVCKGWKVVSIFFKMMIIEKLINMYYIHKFVNVVLWHKMFYFEKLVLFEKFVRFGKVKNGIFQFWLHY